MQGQTISAAAKNNATRLVHHRQLNAVAGDEHRGAPRQGEDHAGHIAMWRGEGPCGHFSPWNPPCLVSKSLLEARTQEAQHHQRAQAREPSAVFRCLQTAIAAAATAAPMKSTTPS